MDEHERATGGEKQITVETKGEGSGEERTEKAAEVEARALCSLLALQVARHGGWLKVSGISPREPLNLAREWNHRRPLGMHRARGRATNGGAGWQGFAAALNLESHLVASSERRPQSLPFGLDDLLALSSAEKVVARVDGRVCRKLLPRAVR